MISNTSSVGKIIDPDGGSICTIFGGSTLMRKKNMTHKTNEGRCVFIASKTHINNVIQFKSNQTNNKM